jgi:hypothetical protein
MTVEFGYCGHSCTKHRCAVSFLCIDLYSFSYFPRVVLWHHNVSLFLVLWGTSTLISTVVALVSIPTNSVWELHKISNVHGLAEISWKWLYCQKQSTNLSNAYPSKSQCQSFAEIHMKAEKTMNSLSNPEQKEQSWRYQNSRLQIILQSHSNKNSMVEAHNQTQRPMEQNKKSTNNSVHLQTSVLWQRSQRHPLEYRQPLQQMVQGKLFIYMHKTETRLLCISQPVQNSTPNG